MNDSLIEVNDLHFAYNSKEVLCSLSFNVFKKDYIALVGDNGSGKSTLIKLILGFLKPQIGTLRLKADKIGYVPQGGLLNVKDFPASVYEVVATRLCNTNLFNLYSKSNQRKVMSALKLVKIEHLKNKRISTLSGGQLQRVLIAREMVMNPEVLLLDEPTTGLDTTSIESLFRVLKDLNTQGLTIILVNHNFAEVSSDVSRIFKLENQHLKELDHVSV